MKNTLHHQSSEIIFSSDELVDDNDGSQYLYYNVNEAGNIQKKLQTQSVYKETETESNKYVKRSFF